MSRPSLDALTTLKVDLLAALECLRQQHRLAGTPLGQVPAVLAPAALVAERVADGPCPGWAGALTLAVAADGTWVVELTRRDHPDETIQLRIPADEIATATRAWREGRSKQEIEVEL